MAATPKRTKGTLVAATATDVLTVPVGSQAIVVGIRVASSTATAAAGDIVAFVNGTADSDAVAYAQSVAGTAAYGRPVELLIGPNQGGTSVPATPAKTTIMLNGGDVLKLKAVNASGYVISYIEVT